jgi:hypothetical protein
LLNYGYYFSTSTSVNLEGDYIPNGRKVYSDIERDIENERERIGNKIYSDLEKYYDELNSDEVVIETIETNEYEFTQDGKIYL